MPAVYSPSVIDAASTDNIGSYSMAPNGYGWAQQNQAFVYANRLYYVLYRTETGGPDFSINVFTSNDSGNTWTILDAANAPVRGSSQATGGCYFDGLQTITVAWTDGSIGVNGVIHLQDFNLSTSRWGLPYGMGTSPAVQLVNQIYKRSDGTLIALFNRTFAAGRVQGLTAAVFTAGAWGAPFNVDTNIPAGFVSDSRSATVLDSVGTLHVFTRTTDTATFSHHTWTYQQILLNNTLGNFTNFPEFTFDAFGNGNGNPLIVGNNILFGVMNGAQTHATLLLGTPVINPVFSVMPDPGIDPSSPFSSNGYVPTLTYANGVLFAMVAIRDDTDSVWPTAYLQLRVSQTTNSNPFLGWSETTIFDTRTGPIFFNGEPGDWQFWNNQSLNVFNGNQVFVAAGASIDASAIQQTWFWFGLFTPLVPIPAPILPAGDASGSSGASGLPVVLPDPLLVCKFTGYRTMHKRRKRGCPR